MASGKSRLAMSVSEADDSGRSQLGPASSSSSLNTDGTDSALASSARFGRSQTDLSTGSASANASSASSRFARVHKPDSSGGGSNGSGSASAAPAPAQAQAQTKGSGIKSSLASFLRLDSSSKMQGGPGAGSVSVGAPSPPSSRRAPPPIQEHAAESSGSGGGGGGFLHSLVHHHSRSNQHRDNRDRDRDDAVSMASAAGTAPPPPQIEVTPDSSDVGSTATTAPPFWLEDSSSWTPQKHLYRHCVAALYSPTCVRFGGRAALARLVQRACDTPDDLHNRVIAECEYVPPTGPAAAKNRILAVTVVRCVDLVGKEADGTSNVFCTVRYGDQEGSTSIAEQTLNPTFDETFHFEARRDEPIKVTVWSQHLERTREDKFLGQCTVTGPDASGRNSAHNIVLPLEKRSARSSVSGRIELHVELQVRRDGSGEYKVERRVPPVDMRANHAEMHALLLQSLLKLRGARIARDRTQMFQLSDPRVFELQATPGTTAKARLLGVGPGMGGGSSGDGASMLGSLESLAVDPLNASFGDGGGYGEEDDEEDGIVAAKALDSKDADLEEEAALGPVKNKRPSNTMALKDTNPTAYAAAVRGKQRNLKLRQEEKQFLQDNRAIRELQQCLAMSTLAKRLFLLYGAVFQQDPAATMLRLLKTLQEAIVKTDDFDLTLAAQLLCLMHTDVILPQRLLPNLQMELEDLVNPIVSVLHTAISQYRFRYPVHNNQVVGQLDLAIFLLSLAQRMSNAISQVDPKPAATPVLAALAAAKAAVFRLLSASAQAEHPDSVFIQQLTLADLLEEEVAEDEKYYSGIFKSLAGLNMRVVNAYNLLARHNADMIYSMAKVEYSKHTDYFAMFQLHHRVAELRRKYIDTLKDEYDRNSMKDVYSNDSKIYANHIFAWLNCVDKMCGVWIDRATEADDLEPLNEDVLHSSAVVDSLKMVTQQIDLLNDLEWNDVPVLVQIYASFAALLGKAVLRLSNWFETASNNAKAAMKSNMQKSLEDQCVLVNNIAETKAGVDAIGDSMTANLKGMGASADVLSGMHSSARAASEALPKSLMVIFENIADVFGPTVHQFLQYAIGVHRSKPLLKKITEMKKSAQAKVAEIATKSHAEAQLWKDTNDVDRNDRKTATRTLRDALKASKRHGRWAWSAPAASAAVTTDKIKAAIDPLLAYLDAHFGVFSNFLYEDTFKHVIAYLWGDIVDIVNSLVVPKESTVVFKRLTPAQAVALGKVLDVLQDFFVVGLDDTHVRTNKVQAVKDRIEFCQKSTTELQWMYFSTQADSALTSRSAKFAAITFKVNLVNEDNLNLHRKMHVQVREVVNLPPCNADGSANVRVDISVVDILKGKLESKSTEVIANTKRARFAGVYEFGASVLRGVCHLAVYHVEGGHDIFIGETAFTLEGVRLQLSDEYHQPLTPQATGKSKLLLEVLASRREEAGAVKFALERSGEMLGKLKGSKVHQVNEHKFKAVHMLVPPDCAVCQRMIVGLGKSVYQCDLCEMTVHKKCHPSAPSCSGTSSNA
eukprot:m.202379 g.202379  ORF g.202379 m.202379 type:complete len:1513 (+) comp17718_c0_seq2:295-4833(+)